MSDPRASIAFVQQIFQERDDAAAVRWTYHDFRNAYPKIDTEDAAEIIGHQMLKMGSVAMARGS